MPKYKGGMYQSAKQVLIIALLLIIVAGSGMYMYNYFKGKPQAITLPTQPTQPTSPSGIYAGTVSFLVNEKWAYDQSGLVFTSAAVDIAHADCNTIAGSPTIGGGSGAGTATSIVESTADAGKMCLIWYEGKNSVVFIDPATTKAKNSGSQGGIVSYSVTSDPNQDGINDVVFVLDLSGFSNTNPNLTPAATIILYGWKVSTTTVSFSASSSPTGMTTAGTYTASGYLADSHGNGYETRLQKLTLWAAGDDAANTTAASFETLIQAGTVTLVGVGLYGAGPTSGQMYGATWGATKVAGVPNYDLPSFDVTNTKWVLYQASQDGKGGALSHDISQIAWGMPIIFERNSAANWFQYTITFKTAAAAMTASSKYYIFLEGSNASGTSGSTDASSDALELAITLTG